MRGLAATQGYYRCAKMYHTRDIGMESQGLSIGIVGKYEIYRWLDILHIPDVTTKASTFVFESLETE